MDVTVVDPDIPIPAMSADEDCFEFEPDAQVYNYDDEFERESSSSSLSKSSTGSKSSRSSSSSSSLSSRSAKSDERRSRTQTSKVEDVVASMAPNIVRLERQRVRLAQFHKIVAESPYFDMEDETLVHTELQKVKTTLRDLVSSLSPADKKRLDMFRTLALREQLIDHAVRDDLLHPDEDGVFAQLVRKQIQLTKIVHGQ
jgi:hypothetical protein